VSLTIVKTLRMEFKINFSPIITPGHTHWAISIFLIILLNNVAGLRPYTFTSSSHLSFSVALALFRWASYIIVGVTIHSEKFLAHLMPVGTPVILIPFIVFIELIRNLIRPLTLSVRLAANLVAGHLLIALISSPATSIGWGGLIFVVRGLVMLLILERAVAVIQAYVFRILRTIYLRELNYYRLNYL
jgi:F-type H+-transporting ATPase subunit a